VGPFRGIAEIESAYRDRPPDDEIDVWDATEREGAVVASYGWHRDEGARAGELRITPEGGRIARLVVTFDAPSG
jgi:hypothetical protein